MSELARRRPYTAIDQFLAERFIPSPEERVEYEEQGLIATNNLGLRMLVFEASPNSDLWQFYATSLFTPRMLERLERVRTLEPALWSESVTAYEAQAESSSAYFSALQTNGPDDPHTEGLKQQSASLDRQDVLLRSQIFGIIEQEPLTQEEALALCI